jgi:hypothetical protein
MREFTNPSVATPEEVHNHEKSIPHGNTPYAGRSSENMGDGKRGADLRDYYLLIAHFLAYTASFLRFASYSILFFSFLYAYYFLSLSLSLLHTCMYHGEQARPQIWWVLHIIHGAVNFDHRFFPFHVSSSRQRNHALLAPPPLLRGNFPAIFTDVRFVPPTSRAIQRTSFYQALAFLRRSPSQPSLPLIPPSPPRSRTDNERKENQCLSMTIRQALSVLPSPPPIMDYEGGGAGGEPER